MRLISVPNKAPVSNAGGDRIVTLPVILVEIDGSKSMDDKKIVRYSWERDDKSLAAGVRVLPLWLQSLLILNQLLYTFYQFHLNQPLKTDM